MILNICPDPYNLFPLWISRYVVELETHIKNEDKARENETYERTDKFNQYGYLAFWFFLIRHRFNGNDKELANI